MKDQLMENMAQSICIALMLTVLGVLFCVFASPAEESAATHASIKQSVMPGENLISIAR